MNYCSIRVRNLAASLIDTKLLPKLLVGFSKGHTFSCIYGIDGGLRYEVLMGTYALCDFAAELTELVRREVIHIRKKLSERHASSIAFSKECGNVTGRRRVMRDVVPLR